MDITSNRTGTTARYADAAVATAANEDADVATRAGAMKVLVELWATEKGYEQYQGGYLADWTPMRVKHRIVTKLGVAAERGDIVLVEPLTGLDLDVPGWARWHTMWSNRNWVSTQVGTHDLEAV
jgi:hypothetical protein